MRKSLSRIFTLTRRNFKEILRDPLSLGFLLVMPLVMEIMFYLIFHKMTEQFEMKYLAPGIVVFSQAFLTLFAGLLIAMDRETAFLTRLYVSRAKSFEFILGYVFSLVPIALGQTVLFLLVGGILDPSIFSWRLPAALPLSLLTAVLFISLGILLGSLCSAKAVGGMSSIVVAGQSLLSGMWFPLDGIGKGMITLMNCLPFRNATTLMQRTVLGIADAFHDFWLPMIIVLAYTAVALVAAILVFGRKMRSK